MPAETLPDIPGYTIESELGRGAMGVVYRAIQKNLQRTVALKVMMADINDGDFAERFLREARAAAGINSPYVVGCYDAGRKDDILYMALEFVTGGDAGERLRSNMGALDLGDALSIVRDAAKGLEAVEAAGMIHRDIKPANIFISADGTAKLADLGLVRPLNESTSEMTMAGAILGTPAYMAPEQARGEPNVDIRADIHGLGATLYQLLTNCLAYTGDHPMATLAKVIGPDIPEIPESLPAPVRAVLLRTPLRKYRKTVIKALMNYVRI